MANCGCSMPPAGKMKLEFLENPSLTLLGYSRLSNLNPSSFLRFSGNSLLVLAGFGNNSSYYAWIR